MFTNIVHCDNGMPYLWGMMSLAQDCWVFTQCCVESVAWEGAGRSGKEREGVGRNGEEGGGGGGTGRSGKEWEGTGRSGKERGGGGRSGKEREGAGRSGEQWGGLGLAEGGSCSRGGLKQLSHTGMGVDHRLSSLEWGQIHGIKYKYVP